MPRRPLTVIVVAFLVLALALPAFAQKPIKLGVLTPLSPPGDAGAGQFIVRGAKMGAEDVNARGGILGGRKIELVIEDDSGTPEKGVAGLRKLATQDQVSAVMGQFHSSVALAAQDLAEQFKIPFFITAASARGITEKHLNYTFRMHVIDPDRSKEWTRWIMERGFKRVFVLGENTDYGTGLVEETKKAFKTMGAKAEVDTAIFDRASVDLTPQLLKIKNWKPDLLINCAVGTPVYLMIKQAHDIGLFPSVPMLVSYDLPSRPEFWKTVGEKGNYAASIVYYHPTMKLPARGDAFRKKYQAEFKEEPVYGAFNGYAQIVVIADAIAAAKSDKGEDIQKALLANKFEGWNGTVTFTHGEGPYWQQWTPPILITQYTKVDQPFGDVKIVYPPDLKTGDFVLAPAR